MATNIYAGGAGTVAPDVRLPDDYARVQATPEAFGGAIARGAQELGQGAVKASQFYGQIATDDAVNKYETALNNILHGDPTKLGPDGKPETGFYGLQGEDAMKAYPGVIKQIEDLRNQIHGNLQTPESQLAFDQQSRRLQQLRVNEAGTFYERANKDWAHGVNASGADNQLRNISNDAYNDDAFNGYLENLKSLYVKDAHLHGLGEPGAQDAVMRATQEAWKQRLETIYVHSPEIAAKMVDAHQKELGQLYEPLADKFRHRAEDEEVARRVQYYTGAQNGAGPVDQNLRNDRQRFDRELQQKPWLFGKIANIAMGENNDPTANLAVIESAMNRASVNGTSLEQEFRRHQTEGGYYAGWNPRASASPAAIMMVHGNIDRALNGSNVSNYATDNASGDFGRKRIASGMFNHTASYNGEFFSVPGRADARGFAAYPEWRRRVEDGDERKFTDRLTPSGEEIPDRLSYTKSEAIRRALEDLKDRPLSLQEKIVSGISKVYGDQAAAFADERRALQTRMPDIIKGTLEGNESLAFPEAEIRRAYPEKYLQWREEYNQAKALGPQLRDAPWASDRDLAEMRNDIASGQGWRSELLKSHIKALGSPDPDGDYSKMKATAAAQLDRIIETRQKALDADPAGYVMHAPDVAEKIKALAAVPENDAAGRIQAQRAIMDAVWKKQGELSVPEDQRRVLSKDQAEHYVQQFTDPARTADVLQSMRKMRDDAGAQWGHVFRDMVTLGGLPTGYQSVMDLDDKNARLLARALNEGTAKENKEAFSWDKALGKTSAQAAQNSNRAIIDANIKGDDKVGKFRQSLTDQGVPAASVDSHIHDLETLAYANVYYNRMDPAAAAEAAKKAFLDKYEFLGSARVPADGYYAVKNATRAVENAMSADNIMVPRAYRMNFGPRPGEYASHASAGASWINLPDATGLYALDHTGRIMHWKNGNPVEIKFDNPDAWKGAAGIKVANPFASGGSGEASEQKENLARTGHLLNWPVTPP